SRSIWRFTAILASRLPWLPGARDEGAPVRADICATMATRTTDHALAEVQDERIVGQVVSIPGAPMPAIHALDHQIATAIRADMAESEGGRWSTGLQHYPS